MRFIPLSPCGAVLVVAALGIACHPLVAGEAGVSGWLGNGTGVHPDATPVTAFDVAAGTNIRWTAGMPGRGSGMPVVTGGKVIVTADPDRVLCLDAATGKPLWEAFIGLTGDEAKDTAARPLLVQLLAASRDEAKGIAAAAAKALETKKVEADEFSWALPTPVGDGTHVWCAISSGAVACFDLSGQRTWRVDVTQVAGNRLRGSPQLVDGVLAIAGGKGVVGLDPATGTQKWFAAYAGGDDKRVATPALWRTGVAAFLVCHDRTVIRVIDGKVVQAQGQANADDASPAIAGKRVVFVRGDDHSHGPQFLEAFDLAVDGDAVTLTPAWTELDRKEAKLGGFSRTTPLVLGNRVAHLLPAGGKGNGLLLLNLADGTYVDTGLKVPWSVEHHNWWPSPILAGKLLIVTGYDGTVQFLELGSPWRQVSTQTLEGPIRCSPAVAGDALYFRTDKALVCVGK